MFLFILESIGTPELILIAVVALIVLGPRKLPQMAKTVAKTMAEFRNATNEFKSTWEKEVAFEEEILPGVMAQTTRKEPIESENFISQEHSETLTENRLPEPQIKELTSADIIENFQNMEMAEKETPDLENKTEQNVQTKRDWL